MTIIKKDLPHTRGVYMIVNTITKEFYIGSCVGFQGRWAYHKWALTGQHHHNKRFQQSWDLHGEHAFEFEVLQVMENPTQTDLVSAEIAWMRLYHIPGNPRAFNKGLARHKRKFEIVDGEFCIFYKGVRVDWENNPIEIAARQNIDIEKVIAETGVGVR